VNISLHIDINSPQSTYGPSVTVSVHVQDPDDGHKFAYALNSDAGVPACIRETSIYPWILANLDALHQRVIDEWTKRLDQASEKPMLEWVQVKTP